MLTEFFEMIESVSFKFNDHEEYMPKGLVLRKEDMVKLEEVFGKRTVNKEFWKNHVRHIKWNISGIH